MKRRAITLILLIAILLSNIGIVSIEQAFVNSYIPPEEAPSGYRIYSDGTSNTENLQREGDTYTFKDNIEGTIVVERDNVIIDGAQYTLQGNGKSYGIWLQDKYNITIKNLNIQNFEHGIRFSHYRPVWLGETNPNQTTNSVIQDCNIIDCGYGISLYSSLNCSILNNYIAKNTYGIYLMGSDNTFRNNTIEQNNYNFWERDRQINDIDISNTINGKPVYYWVNQHNMSVPTNAGLVILKNCTGIRVQNLNLTGNGNGLSVYYSSNIEIFGNKIFDNALKGIAVWWSHNNSIIGNQIKNTNIGIEIYGSNTNIISRNLIEANTVGIDHRGDALNEVISSNQIINNQHGGISGRLDNSMITDNLIFGNKGGGILVGSNCIVARNNITLNKIDPDGSGFYGTGLGVFFNNTIVDNYISKNDIGIWTFDGCGNTFMSNSIVENDRWGIRFQGPAQDNLIYKNNFIGNNNNGIQVYFHKTSLVNIWDDGEQGNFWSDYNSSYPNAQGVENSTIGNTPYYIEVNNQDNYPLLFPEDFVALDLPSIQPPQETNPTPEPQPEPFPTTLVLVSVVIIVVGLGVFAYLKKYKRKDSK